MIYDGEQGTFLLLCTVVGLLVGAMLFFAIFAVLSIGLAQAGSIDMQSVVALHPTPITKKSSVSKYTSIINSEAKVASIISSLSASIKTTKSSSGKISKTTGLSRKTSSTIQKPSKSTVKSKTSSKKTPPKQSTTKTLQKSSSLRKSTTTKSKRDLLKRDATSSACVAAPSILYGYVPANSSAAGFMLDPLLNNSAQASWLAPAGYQTSFISQLGAVSTTDYLGFYQLKSYDPVACSAYCNAAARCVAFDIRFERMPFHNPTTDCPNPPGRAGVICALWGSPINSSMATNYGETRASYLVVQAGVSGYNAYPVPPQVGNYSNSIALTGAVSFDTPGFLNSTYSTTPFDNSLCAAKCTKFTTNAKAAALSSGNTTYQPCNFFNAFSLNYLGVYQGQYCVLYNSSSAATAPNQVTFSTTLGAGNSRFIYNITNSWGTSLSPEDSGVSNSSRSYIPTGSSASCSGLSAAGGNSVVSPNKIQYSIACGYDMLNSGDVSVATVPDFYSCFNVCDMNSGCNAFAYSSGTCFLKKIGASKNTTLPSLSANGIDFAWRGNYLFKSALPWVRSNTTWAGNTTTVVTSIISGTGYLITQTPAANFSITAAPSTTYITSYIDSGTANTIATSTASPNVNGTGIISIVYPTPACKNHALNMAAYSPLVSTPAGIAGWAVQDYKTVAPTCSTSASSLGAYILNASDFQYCRGRVDHRWWEAEFTFYLYAGRGSGYYTITLPWMDDYSMVWVGENAISGWNNTNYDIATVQPAVDLTVQSATRFWLQANTYTPVRLAFYQVRGGAGITLNLWAPSGEFVMNSGWNASDPSAIINSGYMLNDILPSPCQARQALTFPTWGAET